MSSTGVEFFDALKGLDFLMRAELNGLSLRLGTNSLQLTGQKETS